MNAVVTAGGRIEGAFAAAAGTEIKALAPVRGISMLERVLHALRACGARRIALVADEDVGRNYASLVERVIEASPSGSENMIRALRAWTEDAQPLLYATSDLPYVNPDALRDFLARAPQQSIAMALVEAESYAARFPGAPPFGIRLAGERVVNGGVFVLPAGSAARVERVATGFFEARKRPWQMAGLVGPTTLLRFVTGRLSVGHLEAKAARVFGMPAAAVRGCAPELAFDVDTAADYRYACDHR